MPEISAKRALRYYCSEVAKDAAQIEANELKVPVVVLYTEDKHGDDCYLLRVFTEQTWRVEKVLYPN